MKIIKTYKKVEDYIPQLRKGDRVAQHKVFQLLSGKMLALCNRYVLDLHTAEDIMICSFLKVFSKVDTFKDKGNFEGWVRRIMVNESISHIRKKKPIIFLNDHQFGESNHCDVSMCDVSMEDIQLLIDELPEGCKIIFNLYVIEGYKHKEISKMLNIQEGTSKSQLTKARKLLQYELLNLEKKGLWNGIR